VDAQHPHRKLVLLTHFFLDNAFERDIGVRWLFTNAKKQITILKFIGFNFISYLGFIPKRRRDLQYPMTIG
jgi:hypothetical protein